MRTHILYAAGLSLRQVMSLAAIGSAGFFGGLSIQAQESTQNAPGRIGPAAGESSLKAPTEIIVLDPFLVVGDDDEGFVAAKGVTGGRIATDLRDSAADYSVQNREFLDALNISNLTEAASWTVNSFMLPDDGGATAFGNPVSNEVRFRGLPGNTQQIDFFPANYNFDSFAIERIDYARGASGVLFGVGSFTGTPNAVQKRANLNRSYVSLKQSFGSWDHVRGTLDANYAMDQKVGVRLNLMKQESGSWREGERDDRTGAALAIGVRPWKGASINLSGQTGQMKLTRGSTRFRDSFSGWNGTKVFVGQQPARDTFSQFGTGATPSEGGYSRLGNNNTPYYLITASAPERGLVDYRNTARTNYANEVRATGTNRGTPVAGVFIPASIPAFNFNNLDFQNTAVYPNNFFANVLAIDGLTLPERDQAYAPNQPNNITDYDNLTLIMNQQFTGNLFVEAAGNYSTRRTKTKLTVVNQPQLFLDINQNLPTGEPNPNFLDLYYDAQGGTTRREETSRNARAGVAWVKNDTRFGSFTFNLSAGQSSDSSDYRRTVFALKDDQLPAVAGSNGGIGDPRRWSSTNIPRFRIYLNEKTISDEPPAQVTLTQANFSGTAANPVFTTTSRLVNVGQVLTDAERIKNKTDYQLFGLQGSLFKNRLILFGAGRRDTFSTSTQNQWGFRAGGGNLQRWWELPTTWDGITPVYRPKAPSDYYQLTYRPRNPDGSLVNPTGAPIAAVTRPRNATTGQPVALYANDRFQDDYSLPDSKTTGTTFSLGSVYHVTSWVSLTGSYGESFSPASTAVRIDGGQFSPVDSDSNSFGVRLSLPQNRASFSASRYRGTQNNISIAAGTGLSITVNPNSWINNLINANEKNDATVGGYNQRGLTTVPAGYAETGVREVEGWEFELTANPIRGMRLTANFALPKAVLIGGYAETLEFLSRNDAVLRAIVLDAGGLINSANVASRDPALLTGQGTDASIAVSSWNQYQDFLKIAGASSAIEPRVPKYTANIYFDYTFQTRAWKGLRVGAGAQLRGKSPIANLGGDTIRDPNNPSVAIDDPTLSVSDFIYAPGYGTYTASLGYEFKLKKKLKMRLDLRVDNLLDYDDPLYVSSITTLADGDLTNPARRSVLSAAGYVRPRYWELSATFNY